MQHLNKYYFLYSNGPRITQTCMVTLKLIIRQRRVGLSGIWVAGNHVHFLIFISYTLILTSAALARSSEELLRRSK